MTFFNLRNRVIAPRNLNRVCTVTFQRLHDGHDFSKWLREVAETIVFAENTEISVGFSFIAWKPTINEKIYLFSAQQLSPFKFWPSNRQEGLEMFSAVGKLSDSQILEKTFINNLSENLLSSSGLCPKKIVCSYIYVTK